ncbi:MAG: FtsL-like putative cell division protein [Chitinophagaceae bacterium]|nr:FtsL-like putative cell division protein [Chitinophagaceae bacterium]
MNQNHLHIPPKPIWKRWLNYPTAVRQIPFFLFISLLATLYIYNGHYAEKTLRKINKLSKEVKELQYEYLDIKSKLLLKAKLSEVKNAAEPLGLIEADNITVILTDSQTGKTEKDINK